MGSINDRVNIGVAAVVTDDETGAFLLSERLADKHGQGEWSFPGGKPDPGESPEVAVLRELKEETGIYADFAIPLGIWTYDLFEAYGVHYVTLYFLVDHRLQEPQRLEPDKHGEWEWLTADEAREKPLFCGVEAILGLMS